MWKIYLRHYFLICHKIGNSISAPKLKKKSYWFMKSVGLEHRIESQAYLGSTLTWSCASCSVSRSLSFLICEKVVTPAVTTQGHLMTSGDGMQVLGGVDGFWQDDETPSRDGTGCSASPAVRCDFASLFRPGWSSGGSLSPTSHHSASNIWRPVWYLDSRITLH